MKKYKNDLIIILAIALIAIIAIIVLNVTSKKDDLSMVVYHNEEIVLTVILDELEEEKTYAVKGDISDIIIMASKEGVKIIESECFDHTCINQGLINNTNQSITCLPNRIHISLVGSESVDIII